MITLFIASYKSTLVMAFSFFLAAKIAASFKRFAMSAPENPAVILARVLKFTSGASGLFLA